MTMDMREMEALARHLAPVIKRQMDSRVELITDGIDPEAFGKAMGEIVREVKEALVSQINQLKGEVESLSRRLESAEERGMKYCGTWQRAMDYRRGDCVTHKGSLWTALKATSQAPEEAASDWQLSAKGAQR